MMKKKVHLHNNLPPPPTTQPPGPSIEEIYGQDKSGNPLPVYDIAPQTTNPSDEPQQI